MKRVDTFTAESNDAFIRTILDAYTEGTSNFRCGLIWCENCPLHGSSYNRCLEELTVEEWCAWAMEDVK